MDLHVKKFDGYELVDSGEGRKLERFGDTLFDRPCPQAIWPAEGRGWERADAAFQRAEGGTGDWETATKKNRRCGPATWSSLRFDIRMTGFGNVGLFPEHTCHWSWMQELLRGREGAKVLNLFAYTGGASMACAAAGASVTHVDSAKSVNAWAAANAESSGVDRGSIRFITDDALKFVRREQRRGNRYHGVILDPPTFGRGSKGEVWKIERDFFKLAAACLEVLHPSPLFALATSHSPGVTPSVLRTLLDRPEDETLAGEMLIDGGGPPLPSGVYARWSPQKVTG